jgi:hypothetical protein
VTIRLSAEEAWSVLDDDLRARVRTTLDDKYRAFRTQPAAMPDATRRHYDVVMTVLQITPDDRILYWDNSRLQLDG